MRRALVPPARALVRMPSWLGDFVACEPLVRAAYARWNSAGVPERLSISGPARFLALFDGRFEHARRIDADDARAWRGHDVALLLNGSWRSAACALRAGIPERASWARGARSILLTTAIEPARERGAVPLALGVHGRFPRALPRPFGAACVELAALLGLEVRDRAPRLEPSPLALERARTRLAQRGVADSFVLAHAGARADSAKGFPAASWNAAILELQRASTLPLVVACAPGEEANAREASRGTNAILLDDPPPDLAEIVALTALSRVVVTADSGPRHLARALQKPCVVMCGPTDPRHTSEHDRDVRIVRVEVPCGPCHRELCPLTGADHHACMRRIDARDLARAVVDLELRRALSAQ